MNPRPRRSARSTVCVLAILAPAFLFSCNDVGDSTGLTPPPGEDSGADSTVGAGEAGGEDGGPSSDATVDTTGGYDVEQASDTGASEASQEPEDGGVDAPGVEPDAEGTPETGAPEAAIDSAAQDAEPEASAAEAGAAEASTDAAPDASATHPDAEADAAPDSSGAHPDAGADAATEAGGGELVPCTTAGQTGCVKCQEPSGVCTATEAFLVQIDIDMGMVKAAGADPVGSCYACAVENFCIDTSSQTGFECDDLAGNFTNGAGASVVANTACLETLECIMSPEGQDCPNAPDGISACYCGNSDEPSTTCSTNTSQNGPCLTQEVAGFHYTPGSTAATTILQNFTTQSQPSGMANAMAECLGPSGNMCPCGI